MTDFTARVAGSGHEHYRQERKNQDGECIPGGRWHSSSALPERNDRKRSGDFHEPYRQLGRSFVSLDEIVGDAGIGYNLFLRSDAGYKRWNRQQGNGNKNDKAAQPHIFSPNNQGG